VGFGGEVSGRLSLGFFELNLDGVAR